MKPIKLEDLLPEKPEFFLQKKNRTFTLRPPNMRDQVWIRNKYPEKEAFEKIMRDQDWGEIAKVIFYLLKEEDKREFMAQEATIVNDEGEEAHVRLSGPDVLLTSIQGIEETLGVLAAFNKAIAISNPVLEETLKKSLKEIVDQAKSVGPKSLTPSKISTDKRKKK